MMMMMMMMIACQSLIRWLRGVAVTRWSRLT